MVLSNSLRKVRGTTGWKPPDQNSPSVTVSSIINGKDSQDLTIKFLNFRDRENI